MIPLRRLSRPLALVLVGLLLGAALTPLALRARQQLFPLSPGDSLVVTCETSIGGFVSGAKATIACAAPGDDGATEEEPAVPTPELAPTPPPAAGTSELQLRGVRDGQALRGTVDIEAVPAGADVAKVVFTLDGPQPAVHTEKRAPYYFLGDDDGQPRGWDTSAFPDGDYTLTVAVESADGASTTASVALRVANAAAAEPTAVFEEQDEGDLDEAGAERSGELQFGAAAHLFYVDRAPVIRAARGAGFGWIRQQIHWKDLEGPEPGNYAWGELDPLVDSVDQAGLKLLLAVVRSPRFYTADGSDGMPDDPQVFGDFVAALAERYQGKVAAIEIWNEQNLAHENGGRISIDDAGRYVELLKAAYPRIKAVDPSITVLAGPPSSTGISDPAVAVSDMAYLEAMYAYDGGVVRDYFDAQAAHPGGAANPPETFVTDNPSTADGWTDHETFYFRHVEDVRRLMEDHGMASKPVWITEFGWATRNSTPGYEFGNQVSAQEQAEYVVGAMEWTQANYPWVEAMFIWNLNFAPLKASEGDPLHEQASFSLLDARGRPRPVYSAVKEYLSSR